MNEWMNEWWITHRRTGPTSFGGGWGGGGGPEVFCLFARSPEYYLFRRVSPEKLTQRGGGGGGGVVVHLFSFLFLFYLQKENVAT